MTTSEVRIVHASIPNSYEFQMFIYLSVSLEPEDRWGYSEHFLRSCTDTRQYIIWSIVDIARPTVAAHQRYYA